MNFFETTKRPDLPPARVSPAGSSGRLPQPEAAAGSTGSRRITETSKAVRAWTAPSTTY